MMSETKPKLTRAQRRTLDLLRAQKGGNPDEGWISDRDIPGPRHLLQHLLDVKLIERHRVAGETEYRAV